MEPAPIKAEMPPKLAPEAKPSAPVPAKEQPVPSEKSATSADATTPRGQLEAIAKGTPVKEATAQKAETVALPDREKVDAILSEANTLLLDLRDMRFLLTAVASQAADTPLGNEMRLDTLRIIGKMSNADMPPEAVMKLDALQKQVTELKLPDPAPEKSALLPIIEVYNQAHPDKAVPAEVIDQIKSGSREASTTVAQFLQTNPDLAQPVWKELTGVEGFTGLHLTPTNVLELAKLPASPENVAKAKEMFGTIQKMSPAQQESLKDYLVPRAMFGAMLLMAVIQIGTGQGDGGH